MTKYPAQIDNATTLPIVVDDLNAATVNALRSAIIALETELGVKPSGVSATVKARLDAIDLVLASPFALIDKDLGGVPSLPKVIGFQGRPVNTTMPLINQVYAWDGLAWTPKFVESTLNVLPTAITLPVDIMFLSGDGYNSSSSPFRIGARSINTEDYPYSYVDNRIRTLTFSVDLQVTNGATTGYVQLKDVTHNAIILNSILSTSSTSVVELSSIITSGTTDGYIRDDVESIYEVQIYVTGGGPSDQVICRNARITASYSLPITVTALVPLALPTDIQIVAGTVLNGFTTPASVGGRYLQLGYFNPNLPDGRPRHIFFNANVEVSAPGVDGYIQLYDTTHNVVITGTYFHFTSTSSTELSIELYAGQSDGQIRKDVPTRYEIQLWKVSGSPADRVICNNARLTIMYYNG